MISTSVTLSCSLVQLPAIGDKSFYDFEYSNRGLAKFLKKMLVKEDYFPGEMSLISHSIFLHILVT